MFVQLDAVGENFLDFCVSIKEIIKKLEFKEVFKSRKRDFIFSVKILLSKKKFYSKFLIENKLYY